FIRRTPRHAHPGETLRRPGGTRPLPARGAKVASTRDRRALSHAAAAFDARARARRDRAVRRSRDDFPSASGRRAVRSLRNGVVRRLNALEREQSLDAALSQIERQYGKGAVMKMGDQAQVAIPSISTGSLSLDVALG